MSDQTSITRKKVFVDKRFQTRFILIYLLLMIVGTLLFNAAAYFILDRACGESLFSAHLAITRTGDLLLPTMVYLSLAFIVILGAATLLITMLVSHKISGPLFAIVRYLEMVSDGRLDFEARLRTKDQTAVVAETLTETVKTLAGRVSMMQEAVDSLKSDLNEFSSHVQDKKTAHGETARYIHDLNEHLRILEDLIAFFKT